ncbi:MAG: carboxylesterase/lipase family protein [Pseudomonadota bacterium]
MDATRRRALRAAIAAAGVALMPASASARPAPIARTRSGRVSGLRDALATRPEILIFRGIPYGADTAASRFLPPRREAPWRGVRDADRFGPSAPQSGALDPGREDCLVLNVWTPALRDGAKRPVVVYLHGGAYNTGSGSDPLYDGVRLCRRGDVVVVTVNHRLNLFGYLFLGEFDSRYADSGNVGQLDLIAALRWVREHAAEFGGDADNITLFGQSGGGAKIATLMATPEAAGLFHRAMTMSGQQVTAAGPRAAAQRARLFLDALGVAPERLDALRTLSIDALLQAAKLRDPSRVEDMSLYFGPVLDGRSLTRHPFHPDAPPQSAGIPMIIGNTRDETRAFLGNDPANHALTWSQLPERLRRHQYVDLPVDDVVAEYRRLYPHYTPSQVFFAATTAGRSWRGAVLEAEARARQGAPTWVYQLDFPSPLDDGRFGAMHTLDIPLVFDNIGQPGSRTGDGADAQRTADAMSDALIAFARSGDPDHPGMPHWPRYDLERRATMLFDAEPRVADDPRGGERRLYERAPFVQRGTF